MVIPYYFIHIFAHLMAFLEGILRFQTPTADAPVEAAAMLPAMDHLSSPATCPPNAQAASDASVSGPGDVTKTRL